MNNAQIAGLLRRQESEKNALRLTRAEMLKVCVDQLGILQADVMKIDPSVLLDGYLIGQGVMQEWRKAEASADGGDHDN